MYENNIKLDIILDDSYNIDVYRTITVRKFKTNIKCDLKKVNDSLNSNYLKHGKEFGCINVHPGAGSIHAMFGQIGDSHITSYDTHSEQNVELIHYLIRNVVKSTMHIDHFCEEDDKLGLIMYGGGDIKDDLIKAMYKTMLNSSYLKIVEFDEDMLRKLCFEVYFRDLYDIEFDPAVEKTFGNVHLADYKSKKNERINYQALKIQEIKDNNNIKIRHFKSKVTATHDKLSKSYDVKFTIDVDGKISLNFPKLSWNHGTSSLDAEIYFYEFARSIYDEIINPGLFKPNKQREVFDFEG